MTSPFFSIKNLLVLQLGTLVVPLLLHHQDNNCLLLHPLVFLLVSWMLPLKQMQRNLWGLFPWSTSLNEGKLLRLQERFNSIKTHPTVWEFTKRSGTLSLTLIPSKIFKISSVLRQLILKHLPSLLGPRKQRWRLSHTFMINLLKLNLEILKLDLNLIEDGLIYLWNLLELNQPTNKCSRLWPGVETHLEEGMHRVPQVLLLRQQSSQLMWDHKSLQLLLFFNIIAEGDQIPWLHWAQLLCLEDQSLTTVSSQM